MMDPVFVNTRKIRAAVNKIVRAPWRVPGQMVDVEAGENMLEIRADFDPENVIQTDFNHCRVEVAVPASTGVGSRSRNLAVRLSDLADCLKKVETYTTEIVFRPRHLGVEGYALDARSGSAQHIPVLPPAPYKGTTVALETAVKQAATVTSGATMPYGWFHSGWLHASDNYRLIKMAAPDIEGSIPSDVLRFAARHRPQMLGYGGDMDRRIVFECRGMRIMCWLTEEEMPVRIERVLDSVESNSGLEVRIHNMESGSLKRDRLVTVVVRGGTATISREGEQTAIYDAEPHLMQPLRMHFDDRLLGELLRSRSDGPATIIWRGNSRAADINPSDDGSRQLLMPMLPS